MDEIIWSYTKILIDLLVNMLCQSSLLSMSGAAVRTKLMWYGGIVLRREEVIKSYIAAILYKIPIIFRL